MRKEDGYEGNRKYAAGEVRVQVVSSRTTLIIVYLLCQVTRAIGSDEDFVVKDGKVKSQTQSNRMGRLELNFAHVKCFLIRLLRLEHHTSTSKGTGWGPVAQVVGVACGSGVSGEERGW